MPLINLQGLERESGRWLSNRKKRQAFALVGTKDWFSVRELCANLPTPALGSGWDKSGVRQTLRKSSRRDPRLLIPSKTGASISRA